MGVLRMAGSGPRPGHTLRASFDRAPPGLPSLDLPGSADGARKADVGEARPANLECYSARVLDANRRANLLKSCDSGGSNFGA